MKAPSRPRAGFTLVEMIATILVLAAIGSVASRILITAVDGYVEAATRAQLHVEGSIAMDRIVRELRMIPLDAGAADIAPNIDSIAASAITWETDNSLTLNGTDLELVKGGGAATVLLSDVSAFAVAAADESNAALGLPLTNTGCDPVRRLTLTITLERHGATETVRTGLFLRSTMSGGSP